MAPRKDSPSPETAEPEPVDAEFEPVSEAGAEANAGTSGKGGPGWFVFVVWIVLTAALAASVSWGLTRYLSSAPGADLSALEARLTAIEDRPVSELADRVSALEAAPETASLAALEALQDEISRLRTDLETLPRAPSGEDGADTAGTSATLDNALLARLETIEALANQALDEAGIARETADTAQAAARDAMTTLQSASETAVPTGNAQADPALAAEIVSLREELAMLRSAFDQTIADLSSRDVALGDTAQTLEVALGALSSRLDEVEASSQMALASAQSAQTADSASTQSLRLLAGRALGLTALRDAAAGSAPFEAERAALARVWQGQSDIQALQALARSGAPTRADLADQFPAGAIRTATGGTRSWFGLVELRPADGRDGADGPLSITAQAEARLERNDLAGAVEAIERLEGGAAEAARDWLLGARARVEIEARLASLRTALSEASAAEGLEP